MVTLAPRNESEFKKEIREGLYAALPGLVNFDQTHSDTGMPDTRIEFLEKGTKKVLDVSWVEFKYSKSVINSLFRVWELLRENQKMKMMRMALDGKKVFLSVCYGGIESSWYIFNQVQCKSIEKNEAEPYTALALLYNSVRRKNGLWSSGQDWGEIDEGPVPHSLKSLYLPKKNGLILPK